jgi:hypothetical protein
MNILHCAAQNWINPNIAMPCIVDRETGTSRNVVGGKDERRMTAKDR